MHLAVLGAGTTGTGIAHAAAAAGHGVSLRDLEPNAVMDAIDTIGTRLEADVDAGSISRDRMDEALADVDGTTDLESAVASADLVIEAVPDDLGTKRDLLAELEGYVGGEVVVATTTASLPVSAVASALERPERVVGLRFFDTAGRTDLVEVVAAEGTDGATVAFAAEFVEGLGKTPIAVEDTPGFASARLRLALAVEAMRMVEDGIAGVREVDLAMELGYDHPVGPLERADRIGLDECLETLERIAGEVGDRFEPPELLRSKVRAGHLGRKAGRGFYDWESGGISGVADGGDPLDAA